jgi:hypothetical protein
MSAMRIGMQPTRERFALRIGAVCAIVGAVVSVAAGTGFGNRTVGADTETVLRYIAGRPDWYWPVVHLLFIVGALLWVGAFIALAGSLTEGVSWALGRFSVASITIGAAIRIVDSSINGFGLAALARSWAAAPASERPSLLRAGDLLLQINGGIWASVITFFHGMPFILLGLAVVFSRRYRTWIGWIGVAGGTGSVVLGVAMFLGATPFIYVAFAIVVSLWMVAMGTLMWRRAGAIETNGTAEPARRDQAAESPYEHRAGIRPSDLAAARAIIESVVAQRS